MATIFQSKPETGNTLARVSPSTSIVSLKLYSRLKTCFLRPSFVSHNQHPADLLRDFSNFQKPDQWRMSTESRRFRMWNDRPTMYPEATSWVQAWGPMGRAIPAVTGQWHGFTAYSAIGYLFRRTLEHSWEKSVATTAPNDSVGFINTKNIVWGLLVEVYQLSSWNDGFI